MNITSKYEEQLDNPAWHSLNETHTRFCVAYDQLYCYNPDFCPFGGFTGDHRIAPLLEQYAETIENFFIIGNKPEYAEKLWLKQELVCLQMVLRHIPSVEIKETIVPLTPEHADELFELVTLVQPGYFRRKTMELGDYFGIFRDNQLVAVTGERMKLNRFTELSAIVTHPGFGGKGYASQLTAHVAGKALNEGKTPFLHVTETNEGAIRLYKKLGFETRRKMSFWNFVRQ